MPLYGKEHEWEVRLYEKYDKTGRKYFMGQIFTTYDTKNKKGINIYGFVNFKDRVAEQHLKDRQVVRGYGWINLRENNRRLDDTGRPIVDLNLYINQITGVSAKYSFEKDEPHWEQQRQPQQPQQQRQYVEENDYTDILPDDLPF